MEVTIMEIRQTTEDASDVGSIPIARSINPGSGPETWVTLRTGYMGNTFGPKGFSSGSNTRVSRSKYPRS